MNHFTEKHKKLIIYDTDVSQLDFPVTTEASPSRPPVQTGTDAFHLNAAGTSL